VLAIARVSEMQRALSMLHILQKHAHFRLFEPHVHPASKPSLVKQSIDLVDRDPDSCTACSHVLIQRLSNSLPRMSCWRYCSNWWRARDMVSMSKHKRNTVSGAFRAVRRSSSASVSSRGAALTERSVRLHLLRRRISLPWCGPM